MTKLDLQYDLINYTPASATPPQSNFSRIEQHINQEVVDRDGTVAMRAQLKLVGDPVAPLDAATKQYVDAVLPVGIIMMYGGATTPPGGRWAICNGAELETATYPELFAVVGTSYGSGAAGRFNLPNLVERFAMGTANGRTGGTADMPIVNHTHPIDHTHAGTMTGVEDRAHVHAGINHNHGVNFWSGLVNIDHHHLMTQLEGPAGGAEGAYGYARVADWTIGGASGYGHTHPMNQNQNIRVPINGTSDGADRDLTTGGQNVNHLHGVNIPGHSGASGNPAGGVAASAANLPPFCGVTHIIRVN